VGSDNSSRGCRGQVTGWLALVLAGLVAVSLPLTLAARATGRVLFDPETVSSILAQNLIDSGLLRQVVVQGLFSKETNGQLTASDLGRLMTYASPEQRQEVVDLLVPSGWAETQLKDMTTAFYSWIDSDAPAPDLVISLIPIRRTLLNGGVADFVDLIWSTWPACTAEQQAGIEAALLAGQSPPLTACQLTPPEAEAYRRLMASALESEALKLPDSLPVVDPSAPGSSSNLQQVKELLVYARLLSTWLWLLPASLLGLIVALVVRSWAGLFRWWGISLLSGGFAAMALAGLASTLGARWLEAQLAMTASTMSPVLHDVIVGVATEAYRSSVGVFFRQALLVAGGAGVVTLLGVLSGSGDEREGPSGLRQAALHTPPDPGEEDEGDHPSGMFG
jgi:hypothetical protein